jgi:Domain of unknown function (DUF4136)/Protein of unknown function (DUF2950)
MAAGPIGFTAGIVIGAAFNNDYDYGPYGWHGAPYMSTTPGTTGTTGSEPALHATVQQRTGPAERAVRAADAPPAGQPPRDLVAGASDDGCDLGARKLPEPFHGYYFRILTAQGPTAPGGEMDYLGEGEMSGGFALLAWGKRLFELAARAPDRPGSSQGPGARCHPDPWPRCSSRRSAGLTSPPPSSTRPLVPLESRYNKGRGRTTAVLVLASSSLLVGAPTVRVQWDRGADFSRYQTFHWVEGQPALDPEVDRMIRETVDNELSVDGIFPDEAEPGLQVSYYASAKEEVAVTGGYSADWTQSGAVTMSHYLAGTLVIDVVDAAENRLLWRATATATVTGDRKKSRSRIPQVVKKMFADFPPSK